MNRLLIVPGIALLAGGLYLFIFDSDKPGDAKPSVSISLGEPKPIGSSEIGTTTVTDAVEFEVIPVDLSSEIEPSGEESQAEVVASDDRDSAQTDLSVQAGSSETLTSSDDGNSEDASAVVDVKSEIESDQQQASNYIEHEIVIDSSLYRATNDAGLSANQTARIGKIIEPYLDASSELRKGDKLIVILDTAAGEAENDADQVHRLEYHGARKTLVITRVADSLSDYEAGSGDGVMRDDEASSSMVV